MVDPLPLARYPRTRCSDPRHNEAVSKGTSRPQSAPVVIDEFIAAALDAAGVREVAERTQSGKKNYAQALSNVLDWSG